MECMRSFSIGVNLIENLSGAAVLKQWTTGPAQHFWQVNTGTSSTFTFEGFRNLDVYGIDVLGSIQTQVNTVINGVIVNDWQIDVRVGGQNPLVGGIATGTNYYAIDSNSPENQIYPLGKFNNSVKFATPIMGSKFLEIQKTRASGIGYETLATVNLWTRLNFIVYYRFEGE